MSTLQRHPANWSSEFCSGVAAILDDCPRCRVVRRRQGLPETAVELLEADRDAAIERFRIACKYGDTLDERNRAAAELERTRAALRTIAR